MKIGQGIKQDDAQHLVDRAFLGEKTNHICEVMLYYRLYDAKYCFP